MVRPLLPRLLFIGFLGAPRWQQIEMLRPDIVTGIVVDWLTGAPYRFSQAAIDWAKSHDMGDLADNPVHDPASIKPDFRIGTIVRFRSDTPFEGFEFCMTEVRQKSRHVLLNMLGRETPVKFKMEQLEAV